MKKLIIAGVSLVVVLLVAAFIYIGNIEKNIEKNIRANIKQTSFSVGDVAYNITMNVENIDYSVLCGTLYLEDVKLEVQSADLSILIGASSMSVTDVNTDLENSAEKLPIIFGNFSAENFTSDVKRNNKSILNLSIDFMDIDDYAQNILAISEQYQKNALSEEFFEAVLNYTHGGIEVEGYKLVTTLDDPLLSMQLSADKVIADAMTSSRFVSAHYENIEIIQEFMRFRSALLGIEDFQMPSAKALATAAQRVMKLQGYDSQPSFVYDALAANLYEDFSYTNSAPFSRFYIQEMKIVINDKYLQGVTDNEIAMDKFNIDLKFDKIASVTYALENLSISTDFLSASPIIDAGIRTTIDAFITDNIVINLNTTNVADLEKKTVSYVSSGSFSQLFETSASATAQYDGTDIWSILFLGNSEYSNSILYNKMSNHYTDKGLLPLAVNIAAMLTGLPPEPLVQTLKERLVAVAEESFEASDGLMDTLAVEIAQAMVVMLDKPGSIGLEVDFTTPYTFADLFIMMPTDFSANVTAEPGTKTILELTPKALVEKEEKEEKEEHENKE